MRPTLKGRGYMCSRSRLHVSVIGILGFEFVCNLVLGIWNLPLGGLDRRGTIVLGKEKSVPIGVFIKQRR